MRFARGRFAALSVMARCAINTPRNKHARAGEVILPGPGVLAIDGKVDYQWTSTRIPMYAKLNTVSMSPGAIATQPQV